MKQTLFSLFLFCFMQNLFAQTNDVDLLKKLNEDFLHSIAIKDSSTLSKILADDFILINPSGQKRNKTDNLLSTVSPNIQFTSINIDSVNVRMLNSDVGIVSCWTTFIFTADGKETTGKNCYQDVYMKRKNKWQAVSAHVTILSMK
jgi:hypothetical protein